MRRAPIPGFLLLLSAFACGGDDVPATSDTPNDTEDTGVQSDTEAPADTEDTSEPHDTDETDDTDEVLAPGDTADTNVPGDAVDATDTQDTGDPDGSVTPSECSPAWLAPSIPTTSTCGGEGQLACALSDPEYADNGQSSCDRGLVEQGGRCVAGLRRQAFIADYRTSWEAWAVAFERDQLGFDEPWNWTMQLHAHNGYNNFADGYIAPNQHLSLTDQLEAGVRGINLDVVYAYGRLQLCHGGPPCIATDRGFTRALLELRDWLQKNPLAIIMVRLEDRFPSPTIGGRDGVSALLDAYFGDLIVDPSTLGGATATSAGSPWPTRRELLALGKRVIVTRGTEKCSGTQPPEGCGDNSIVYDLEWFNVDMQDTGDCISASQNGGKLTTGRSEDRTAYTIGSLGADLINGDEVAAQARCSLSQIELDFIFAAEHSPFTVCGEVPEACPDPDHRVGRSVWSFAEDDRGERGPALLGGDGRWRSTPRTARHHFACTASPDPIAPSDWVVTSASGTYDDGASACAALGGQFRFAAPVRSIQNAALTASAHGLPVWIAVERRADGAWSVNGALTCPATAAPSLGCEAHGDCYEHVPLDTTSAACCAGTCAARQPDYLGVHWCPHECRVSASAPPGTCGESCYEHFECGGEGQAACTIDKCFPSCVGGLTEFGGVCTAGSCYGRWGCGGEGQAACTIDKCFPSCDRDLVEFGGVCTAGTCYQRWGCGGSGQPACTIDKCFPSCDDGLRELGGVCTAGSCYERWGCGGDGQAACTVDKCFPSCDADLSEFGGQCASTCYERWDCGGRDEPSCRVDRCVPICEEGLEWLSDNTCRECHDYFECGRDGERACNLLECVLTGACAPGVTQYGDRCSTGTCYDAHSCGGEGEPACTIDRCFPSCSDGRTQYGGICSSGTCYDALECGGDGQAACTIDQCFPSCEGDLTEYGGRCDDSCHERWNCGGNGQAACTIDRCLPSCKPGLTERAGQCTNKSCHEFFNCGGDGQAACTIDRCLPSCRAGLNEYAGQCATSCYARWNCGGYMQTACTIDKCFPSCSNNYSEHPFDGNRCY